MLEKLQDIARMVFNDEIVITEESNIRDIFGCDELDILDYCVAVEDEFEIEIDSEEFERVNNIGDMIELIQNKKGF